jgi:pimeloyl-ACP methyl ester carboxylesterase
MAVIDVGNGIHLAFLDSGPPSSAQTYTTLLFLHGYGWNASKPNVGPGRAHLSWVRSDIWEKVVTAAPARGVRVIAIHRRHYGDSTKFTDEELAPVTAKGPSEAATMNEFMSKRATELATFIKKLVQSADLPQQEGGQSGIVLVGWSLGNMYSIDFLARYANTISDLQAALRTHVRCYLIYGECFQADTVVEQLDLSDT